MSPVTETEGRANAAARMTTWFPPLAHLNPPNLVTSASVVLGVSALFLLSSGHPEAALLCGMATVPCDVIDGALARRMGLQSSFGASLDSLADAMSFCLLPALISHGLGLGAWYQLLVLVIYVLAGVWRLAHFEQAGMTQWRGRPAFVGMPTPYAASCVYLMASLALWRPGETTHLLLTFGALALGLAMVSAVPFRKGGWHYRVMWLLLPLGALLACLK